MNLILTIIVCLIVTTACRASKDKNLAVSSDIGLEEQVLLRQEGVTVTLESFEDHGTFGPGLNVLVENDSERSIVVKSYQASINGLMVKSVFESYLSRGKKVRGAIEFEQWHLDASGISVIKDIEFILTVFDADSWDELVRSDVIQVTTRADPSYKQTYDDSGVVVMEEDGFKIVMKKVSNDDSYYGEDIYVYIENNSDQDAVVELNSMSVNGFEVDTNFAPEVLAGKKAFEKLGFSQMSANGDDIETANQIEISFHISQLIGWETILDTAKIDVTLE